MNDQNSVISNLPKAMYSGELSIGDVKIPCAVLDNGARVLSETGITKAILGTISGASRRMKKVHQELGAPLPVFIAPSNLKPFISASLTAAPLTPVQYRDGNRIVSGFDAALLPIVCDIWLKAREAGALQKQQLEKAQKAEILMRGLAHIGIIALVDEATGYQEIRDRKALEAILEKFISKELSPWAKQFPDEFYKEMFRLKKWDFSPLSIKRPGVVGHYTNDVVYDRIAPGILEELKRVTPKSDKGKRSHRYHQHLTTDVGHPKLTEHLSNVIILMKASTSWKNFHNLLDRALPRFGRSIPLFELEDDD